MSITFRAELPSIDQFASLYATTGWNAASPLSSDELTQALQGSWYAVAAYDGDQLVGFGRLVGDAVMYAMVHDMIVAPDHQRQGIGAHILELLVNKCLEANVRDLQLFAARGKREFYEQRGFVVRPDHAPGMQYRREPHAPSSNSIA